MDHSEDDLEGNNEDTMYEDPNTNVGIHNMSTGSETSIAAVELNDEKNETERSDERDEDGLEIPVRREAQKDTLRTTKSGDIIKTLPYVIPRKQR